MMKAATSLKNNERTNTPGRKNVGKLMRVIELSLQLL